MEKDQRKPLLSKMFDAIAREEQGSNKQRSEELRAARKHKELQLQVSALAQTYGERETVSVETDMRGIVVGFRLVQTTRLVTRPVEIAEEGQKISLWVEEKIIGEPDCSTYREGFTVWAQKHGNKENRIMFHIGNKTTQNCLGKKATIAEMNEASRVLGYIEEAFEKLPSSDPRSKEQTEQRRRDTARKELKKRGSPFAATTVPIRRLPFSA